MILDRPKELRKKIQVWTNPRDLVSTYLMSDIIYKALIPWMLAAIFIPIALLSTEIVLHLELFTLEAAVIIGITLISLLVSNIILSYIRYRNLDQKSDDLIIDLIELLQDSGIDSEYYPTEDIILDLPYYKPLDEDGQNYNSEILKTLAWTFKLLTALDDFKSRHIAKSYVGAAFMIRRHHGILLKPMNSR